MKSYLPLLGLASLAVLAGCATDGQSPGSESPVRSQAAGINSSHEHMPRSSASRSVRIDETEIPSDATLDDLLRYAAEHSPRLRAAFEAWRAAVERTPQARALPDPQLSYGYFVERSVERMGMMGRQRISITQMLPGFGKRGLRADMAERGGEVAEERLEAARLAVFSRVKSAYAEYAYVQEAIEVLREVRELVRQFEAVAMARYRAGEVGSADVLRVEMEGERIGDQLRTMQARRAPAAAALNAALGRPDGAPLPTPRLPELPVLDEAAEKEFERWLAANPELRAGEREIARAEIGIELARRQSWPDFMVGADVLERRGEDTEGMLMVGISLPIWRNNYAAARREALANRNAAVARRESLERDLESDLRMALFRVRDAERKIRLYRQSLQPLARQSYDSLAGAYRAAESDFVDLIEAQRTLLDVELSGRRAVADHVQRLAELERLTGGAANRVK